MTCGKPHAMPCSEVLEQVYVYLDGELGAEEIARIRQHLDECAPCLEEYGLDQMVKALVHRCCGKDHAPEILRERILARIREVRIELQSQE
ncbi:MAG: mycothiol system anti-sigma-R factor [Acidothermus sp.]|nr:mycothiol system anti-sigma-R factor [Acidothermus sp.]MCL6538596.1 mycothiol system anti-sigma-R factor [Acidothermus sp.]